MLIKDIILFVIIFIVGVPLVHYRNKKLKEEAESVDGEYIYLDPTLECFLLLIGIFGVVVITVFS